MKNRIGISTFQDAFFFLLLRREKSYKSFIN